MHLLSPKIGATGGAQGPAQWSRRGGNEGREGRERVGEAGGSSKALAV